MWTPNPGKVGRTPSDPGFSLWVRTHPERWRVSGLAGAANFSFAAADCLLTAFVRALELLVTDRQTKLTDALPCLDEILRTSRTTDQDTRAQV